jgi:hypothetical protein
VVQQVNSLNGINEVGELDVYILLAQIAVFLNRYCDILTRESAVDGLKDRGGCAS